MAGPPSQPGDCVVPAGAQGPLQESSQWYCHRMTNPKCTFDGCFRLARAKKGGLCQTHLVQGYRGQPLTPIRAYGPAKPKQPAAPREKPSLTRDEQGRKLCTMCAQWLHVSLFYPDVKSADCLTSCCGRCNNLSRFKLTRTSYEAMLARQNGACAFCSKPHTEDDPLRVDHDHSCCPGRGSCGKCVRWLLCNGCNTGLGNFQEDEAALLAAVERLRAWRDR